MQKKRILITFSAVLLVFLLNGCKKSEPEEQKNDSQSLESQEQVQPKQMDKAAEKVQLERLERARARRRESRRPSRDAATRENFDAWFDELTKANKAKDYEKLNQLIEKMQQKREGLKEDFLDRVKYFQEMQKKYNIGRPVPKQPQITEEEKAK